VRVMLPPSKCAALPRLQKNHTRARASARLATCARGDPSAPARRTRRPCCACVRRRRRRRRGAPPGPASAAPLPPVCFAGSAAPPSHHHRPAQVRVTRSMASQPTIDRSTGAPAAGPARRLHLHCVRQRPTLLLVTLQRNQHHPLLCRLHQPGAGRRRVGLRQVGHRRQQRPDADSTSRQRVFLMAPHSTGPTPGSATGRQHGKVSAGACAVRTAEPATRTTRAAE
jgi:hypothetical protein